jgi:hypothetical protein
MAQDQDDGLPAAALEPGRRDLSLIGDEGQPLAGFDSSPSPSQFVVPPMSPRRLHWPQTHQVSLPARSQRSGDPPSSWAAKTRT